MKLKSVLRTNGLWSAGVAGRHFTGVVYSFRPGDQKKEAILKNF